MLLVSSIFHDCIVIYRQVATKNELCKQLYHYCRSLHNSITAAPDSVSTPSFGSRYALLHSLTIFNLPHVNDLFYIFRSINSWFLPWGQASNDQESWSNTRFQRKAEWSCSNAWTRHRSSNWSLHRQRNYWAAWSLNQAIAGFAFDFSFIVYFFGSTATSLHEN